MVLNLSLGFGLGARILGLSLGLETQSIGLGLEPWSFGLGLYYPSLLTTSLV